jgi:O-antigen/teichoic acid export membrane protein
MSKETVKHVIVRNVLSNWGGLLVGMVVAFFLSPFLVHRLGDTMYGVRVLALSLTGYMGLLDVGLRVSVVKHVSRLHAMGDHEELNRTVSSSLALYGGVALAVMAATVGLGLVFPYVFEVSPDVLPTARVVLLLSGLSLAASLVGSVFAGFVLGMQRFDLGNASGIVILLVRTALIVVFVQQGYGIIAISAIHLAAQIANNVWLVWLCYRLQPTLRIGWSGVNKSSARALYGYGAFVMMNNVAMLLLFRSGEVVTGMFLGAAAVTYYSVAGSLTEYLAKIIGTMTQVLHPHASAKGAKGDVEGIRTSIIVGTKICLLIALPVSAGFIVLGHPFIAAWMGESYALQAAPLLVVLTVARLFWLSQSATGNILLGVGKHKMLSGINLATGVFSIIGSVLLVRSHGLVGLAVGSAVPIIVMQGLVLPLYSVRTQGISVGHYLSEAVLRPLLGTLPFVVALVLAKASIKPHNLIGVALTSLAAAPVLLIGVYFVAFAATERRRYLHAFLPGSLLPVKEGR